MEGYRLCYSGQRHPRPPVLQILFKSSMMPTLGILIDMLYIWGNTPRVLTCLALDFMLVPMVSRFCCFAHIPLIRDMDDVCFRCSVNIFHVVFSRLRLVFTLLQLMLTVIAIAGLNSNEVSSKFRLHLWQRGMGTNYEIY